MARVDLPPDGAERCSGSWFEAFVVIGGGTPTRSRLVAEVELVWKRKYIL